MRSIGFVDKWIWDGDDEGEEHIMELTMRTSFVCTTWQGSEAIH